MNCDTSICKAGCCGLVPIENTIIDKNRDKLNPNSEVKEFMAGVSIVITEECVCGFLDKDYRCSIYDQRPEICRRFGSSKESHPLLKCRHLGQIDSQKQDKAFDKIMGKIL